MAELEAQKGEGDKTQSTNAPKQDIKKGLQTHVFLLIDQIAAHAENFETYMVF